MQGFRYIDDFDGFAGLDGPVQAAYAVDADDAAPLGILGQCCSDFGLAEHRHAFVLVGQHGELEAEAFAEAAEVEGCQEAGRRDERTVERVFYTVQGVDAGRILSEAA